jgi:hypothetical protein
MVEDLHVEVETSSARERELARGVGVGVLADTIQRLRLLIQRSCTRCVRRQRLQSSA